MPCQEIWFVVCNVQKLQHLNRNFGALHADFSLLHTPVFGIKNRIGHNRGNFIQENVLCHFSLTNFCCIFGIKTNKILGNTRVGS